MHDISTINKKVCRILRDENNSVIYKAWLSFAEDAEFDGKNIIINVPNNYIKEAIESRYTEDLEALYKEDIDFSKLIIRAKEYPSIGALSVSNISQSNLEMGFIPDYKSYVSW